MKKILIAALITIFSFGVGATSFAVNDIASLNNWYLNNIKPIEQSHHHDHQDKRHYKKHEKEDYHDKYDDDDDDCDFHHHIDRPNNVSKVDVNNQGSVNQNSGKNIFTENNAQSNTTNSVNNGK